MLGLCGTNPEQVEGILNLQVVFPYKPSNTRFINKTGLVPKNIELWQIQIMKTNLRSRLMVVFASSLAVILTLSTTNVASAFQAEKPADATQGADENTFTEGKIRFSFRNQDWEDVIPWFAEQAKFSMQPVSEWPTGTFNLTDNSLYTPIEALDRLNHALRMRTPAYTLIRNRKMLILAKESEAEFPNDLIETVKVEDLDSRGLHETISCIFDCGELDAEEMYDEVSHFISSTNRDFSAVFLAANQIRVRETGGNLRNIRDVIKAAEKRSVLGKLKTRIYRLKHQDAETFMLIVRPHLGLPEGENVAEDGSLTVTAEPFSDKLYLRGTEKMFQKWYEIAELVDTDDEGGDFGGEVEPLMLKNYPIYTDPALAFASLQTILEGRDHMKMGQDEATGSILVRGRKADHKLVQETLDTLAGQTDGFDIIPLENADPSELIVALQTMFRISPDSPESGPVLLANSDPKQIIVRGTPQEVSAVRGMVLKFDTNALPEYTGPRTGRRIIAMDETDQDDIFPILKDLLGVTGRQNTMNIIRPEDRRNIRQRLIAPENRDDEDLLNLGNPTSSKQPKQRSRRIDQRSRYESSQIESRMMESGLLFGQFVGVNPFALTSILVQDNVMQDKGMQDGVKEDAVGKTSLENAKDDPYGYKPAPKVVSVPGAPIEVRFTAQGIVLDSKDLDALDDLENEIYRQLGESESSVTQFPSLFLIKHREADVLLTKLEEIFGLSDGGGGGGGGGGLLGGIADNVLGGGGDLLGGLLGGGTGGGGASVEFEGEVRFVADKGHNVIIVSGGTTRDLERISEMIEFLDQLESPVTPVFEKTYTVDVLYRDVEEVKTLVENQISDRVDTGESQGGGQGGNDAQNLAKLVQQVAGGKRGGGAPKAEQKKPKVKLGVDVQSRQILVTGPRFIYEEVVRIVDMLDKKELIENRPDVVILPEVGNTAAIKETLKAVFGDKIVIVSEEEAAAGAPGTPAAGGNARNRNTAASGAGQAKAATDALNALRNLNRGGGGQRGGQRGGRGGAQRGGRGGGR